MGLFDTYKQSFSSVMPMYAGNTLQEEKEANQAKINAYATSINNIQAVEDLQQIPVSPKDKDFYYNTVEKHSKAINDISSIKDPEEMMFKANALARSAKQEYSLLLKNKQAYETTVKAINDGKGTPQDKDLLKKMAFDRSTPLQIDEMGRPVGGAAPPPMSLMDPMDMSKKIREKLDILKENGYTKANDIKWTGDNGFVKQVRNSSGEVSWKGITPQQAMATLAEAWELDPEMKQYAQQDATLRAYEKYGNVQPESLIGWAKENPNDEEAKAILNAVSNGVPAKDAYIQLKTNKHLEDTYRIGMGYSSKLANSTTTEKSSKETLDAITPPKDGSDGSESESGSSKGGTPIVGAINNLTNGESLTSVYAKRDESIATLESLTAENTRLNSVLKGTKEGTQQRRDIEAQLRLNEKNKLQAQSNVNGYKELVDQNIKSYVNAKGGKSYDDIMEEYTNKATTQLNKLTNGKIKNGLTFADGSKLTPKELVDAMQEGRISGGTTFAGVSGVLATPKFKDTPVRITMNDGKVRTISPTNPLYTSVLPLVNGKLNDVPLPAVVLEAKKHLKEKGITGLQSTGITLNKSQQDRLQSFITTQNYQGINGIADILPADANLDKAVVKQITTDGNRLLVSGITIGKGEDAKTLPDSYFDVSGTNASEVIGGELSNNKSASIKTVGAVMEKQVQQRYKSLFVNKIPLKYGEYTIEPNSGGSNYNIVNKEGKVVPYTFKVNGVDKNQIDFTSAEIASLIAQAEK